MQLTAILKDSLKTLLTGRHVVWESRDASIVSVDTNGVVRGVKVDSTHITARSEGVEETIKVRVLPNIDFVLIPADTFQMGSTDGNNNEQPVHTVRLSSFSMSATEVTQGQWKAVMGNNPSEFTGDDDLPIESVRWGDIQTFIRRLNKLRGCGRCYRLPTEAEWEYAARAGTTGDYSGDRDAMGWYNENSGGKTHSVRQKRPNAWGLYDMHGNVWEWVSDWYSSYPSGTVTNPTGPETGSLRVFRGGNWRYTAEYARSAYRFSHGSGIFVGYLGFRLVREVR